ncbi:MAG: GntR family transcriptional regulator [Pseudomonadota bacterium]
MSASRAGMAPADAPASTPPQSHRAGPRTGIRPGPGVGHEAGEEPVSSSEKVVEDILYRLLSGLYVPGQRLVEVDVAQQCGVSRGSVREALKRLSAQGIVTLSRHKGACIRHLSRQEVIDILQIQSALAGLAARLAADRMDVGDNRARFDEAIGKILRFEVHPIGASFHEYRRQFYELLTEISGNRELGLMLPNIQVHLVRVQLQPMISDAFRKRHFKDYPAIAEALSTGDGARAERVIRRHIGRWIDEVMTLPDAAFA